MSAPPDAAEPAPFELCALGADTAFEPALRELQAPEGAESFGLGAAACWDWAVRRNPAGTRLLAARRGARWLALHGALPVRVRAFGEPRVFAQLLAGRSAAGSLGAEALLATARALQAEHGGPQGDLVHYAWPSAGERALLKGPLEYELLRASSVLLRPLADAADAADALPQGVAAVERVGDEVAELYLRCAGEWGASAVRDAPFLNWRFAENPRFRYRLLVVRAEEKGAAAGRLHGFAAYRASPELEPGLGLVMDWLVAPGDERTAELLLAALLACARAERLALLGTSIPEWSPWSLFFQERGFQHRASERLLFVRSALPRLDMLWLRDHWWTTPADALLL